MSETFLSRLEQIAYSPRQEGRNPEERLVRTSDLQQLLMHFRRLDNAARQQYEDDDNRRKLEHFDNIQGGYLND